MQDEKFISGLVTSVMGNGGSYVIVPVHYGIKELLAQIGSGSNASRLFYGTLTFDTWLFRNATALYGSDASLFTSIKGVLQQSLQGAMFMAYDGANSKGNFTYQFQGLLFDDIKRMKVSLQGLTGMSTSGNATSIAGDDPTIPFMTFTGYKIQANK